MVKFSMVVTMISKLKLIVSKNLETRLVGHKVGIQMLHSNLREIEWAYFLFSTNELTMQ